MSNKRFNHERTAMSKAPILLRQGDVLLPRVGAIPKDAKDETPEGHVILAYGEVTGHAHRIAQTKAAPKVRVWNAGAEPLRGWGYERKQADARRIAEIRSHNCRASHCGPVCTFGDW